MNKIKIFFKNVGEKLEAPAILIGILVALLLLGGLSKEIFETLHKTIF